VSKKTTIDFERAVLQTMVSKQLWGSNHKTIETFKEKEKAIDSYEEWVPIAP